MSIRINFADDSNYAVATMTNIRVNRDNVREPDIMSKIEKSSKSQPDTMSMMITRVENMGLIRLARNAFDKQIADSFMYELDWVLYHYFAKQLRNRNYEAMLNIDKKYRISVLDLRRVKKMSEDDLTILNYFGYFDLQRDKFDDVFFNSISTKEGRKYFITIEQNFNKKYVPLPAAVFREYAYYVFVKSGTMNTTMNDVELSNDYSDRIQRRAEWYACQRLYYTGQFNAIRGLIDGHMRKFHETKDKEELFRASLIERMLRRREMKLEVEEDDEL